MPIASPKSIFSLIAGLRASGNGSAATIVPTRISTFMKSPNAIVPVSGAVDAAMACLSCLKSPLIGWVARELRARLGLAQRAVELGTEYDDHGRHLEEDERTQKLRKPGVEPRIVADPEPARIDLRKQNPQ